MYNGGMDKLEIQRRVTEKHGDKIAYLGESVNVDIRQPFKCNVCERVWTTTSKVVLRGSSCPKCDKERRDVNLRKSHGEYIKNLSTCNTIKVKENYVNAKVPILHECVAGHVFKIRPYNALVGQGCVLCFRERKSADQTIKDVDYKRRLEGTGVESINPYLGIMTKSLHKCISCKHEWLVAPTSIVNKGSGCPRCANSNRLTNGFKGKDFILNGKSVKVQGYEPFAISLLLDIFPLTPLKIDKDVPVIKYYFEGKNRNHFPDIYVPTKNLLIEVKSTWTLGLGKLRFFHQICAKRNAAVAQGFNYEVWVFNAHGTKLTLPNNWWELTHDIFKEKFYECNPSHRKRSREQCDDSSVVLQIPGVSNRTSEES